MTDKKFDLETNIANGIKDEIKRNGYVYLFAKVIDHYAYIRLSIQGNDLYLLSIENDGILTVKIDNNMDIDEKLNYIVENWEYLNSCSFSTKFEFDSKMNIKIDEIKALAKGIIYEKI